MVAFASRNTHFLDFDDFDEIDHDELYSDATHRSKELEELISNMYGILLHYNRVHSYY